MWLLATGDAAANREGVTVVMGAEASGEATRRRRGCNAAAEDVWLQRRGNAAADDDERGGGEYFEHGG